MVCFCNQNVVLIAVIDGYRAREGAAEVARTAPPRFLRICYEPGF